MSNQLISALGLAREGFMVFPLQPNGKKPLFAQNWKEIATTDEAVIKRWWRDNPHANVAIRTDGFVGIDLDIRRGGDDSWRDIVEQHAFLGDEIRETRRHETWSGGSHIIFRQPPGILIGCSTDKLGPGVDVKATGGYLVAPTSRIDGKTYRIINPHQPIAELPTWLVELCRQVRARSPAAGKRLVEENESGVRKAEEWLLAYAPDAVEGARDDTGFKVAAKLYNFGVSRDTCREMLSDWNYGHCYPPMDTEAIERLSRSAEVNRSQPIGIDNPELSVFPPVEIADRPPPEPAKKPDLPARLIKTSKQFISNFTPPEYLLDGVIQRRFLYSLTARTGAGKTAIAMWLAQATGLGRSLGKREIRQGRVIYLAGENADDVRMRWIAMAQHLEFDPNTIDVHFIDHRNRKLSEIGPRIYQEVKDLDGAALVVIDTSQAYFEGDDENNNAQALAHAQRMRTLTGLLAGPTVLALCHPIKHATDDRLIPRGGGSFVAEMDGNLICTKDEPLSTLHWHEKFRGADFSPIPFEVSRVEAAKLVDARGRPIMTAIGKPITDAEMGKIEGEKQDEQKQVLGSIRDYPKASLADRARLFGWRFQTGKAVGEPDKPKVNRIIDKLIERKYITKGLSGIELTEKGQKAVKEVPSYTIVPETVANDAATTRGQIDP